MTTNICFHGIGAPGRELEPGEADYWIGEPVFEGMLDEVAGRSDVLLSFDDGNKSDVEIALEALRRRGLRATFFVLAGRLEERGSLDHTDVRTLRDAGMTIGNHGMEHRPWRGMTPQQLRRELVEAREQLQGICGGRVDEAALPLGRYDRRVLRAVRTAGYRRVYSSDRRPARPSSWIQPRYSVRASDTIEFVRDSMLLGSSRSSRLKAEAVGIVKRVR